MQRLEVSGAVRPIYGSLGVKRLSCSLQFVCFSGVISKLYTNLDIDTIDTFFLLLSGSAVKHDAQICPYETVTTQYHQIRTYKAFKVTLQHV